MKTSATSSLQAIVVPLFIGLSIVSSCSGCTDPKVKEHERLLASWKDYAQLVSSRIPEVEKSVEVIEENKTRIGKVNITESDLQNTQSLSNPIVGNISWSYTFETTWAAAVAPLKEEYEFRVQLAPPAAGQSEWQIMSCENRRTDAGANEVIPRLRRERGRWYPYELKDKSDDGSNSPTHKWIFLLTGVRKGKLTK